MFQVEKVLGAFDVVVIQVSEGHGSKRIAFRGLHVLLNLGGQIATPIIRVVGIPHRGEVK
jgi:hypothetical protein